MPKDVGLLIVMGALLLAVAVFIIGWLRQTWANQSHGGAGSGVVMPPPLSGPSASGVWKVSTAIYNWYDLLLAGFIAGVYILPMFVEMFSKKELEVEINLEAAVATIMVQFFMVAMVIGFVAWRQNPVRWLGLQWRMWPLVFPIAILGVLFTWGVLGVLQAGGFIDWLQGHLGNDGKQDVVKAFTETDDTVTLSVLVVMAVIVAPLTEEIMFRGYFYPVAKRFIGRTEAIIFSSLVFAVIHNNAMALLPLCVLAILLALAYEFTGSIWAPIGIHTLFNGATVGAQLALKYGLIQDQGL